MKNVVMSDIIYVKVKILRTSRDIKAINLANLSNFLPCDKIIDNQTQLWYNLISSYLFVWVVYER